MKTVAEAAKEIRDISSLDDLKSWTTDVCECTDLQELIDQMVVNNIKCITSLVKQGITQAQATNEMRGRFVAAIIAGIKIGIKMERSLYDG